MDLLFEHKYSVIKRITICKKYMALTPIFQGKRHFTGLAEAIRCNSCNTSSTFTSSFRCSQTTNFSDATTAFFSSYKDLLEERRGASSPSLFTLAQEHVALPFIQQQVESASEVPLNFFMLLQICRTLTPGCYKSNSVFHALPAFSVLCTCAHNLITTIYQLAFVW